MDISSNTIRLHGSQSQGPHGFKVFPAVQVDRTSIRTFSDLLNAIDSTYPQLFRKFHILCPALRLKDESGFIRFEEDSMWNPDAFNYVYIMLDKEYPKFPDFPMIACRFMVVLSEDEWFSWDIPFDLMVGNQNLLGL